MGGSVIKSRTVKGDNGANTTEKYCGCADGSVFDPSRNLCVEKCSEGYVINARGSRCILASGSPCGAAGKISDGACKCFDNAVVVTEIQESGTVTRTNSDGECVC